MKTIASLLFIIFSVTVVSGQVEVTGNGNVGIGTTSPQAALDLGSATGGRALTWGGSSGDGRYASVFAPYSAGGIVLSTGFHGDAGSDSYLSSYTGSMSRSAIRLNAFGESAGSIQFYTNPASAVTAGDPITPTERMRITASGNVGIGTLNPSSKLDVGGAIRISGGYALVSGPANSIIWGGGGGTPDSGSISFGDNTGWRFHIGTNVSSVFMPRLTFVDTGNVGIGTTSPSHKLQVAGSVRATSFISDTATYADFVFAPDYQLASLSEVEAHIKAKGHLPDIPSEAEARANGIDLAAMQVKLLQKIEELTLHQIAQEKRLNAQADRISQLETENGRLRAHVASR